MNEEPEAAPEPLMPGVNTERKPWHAWVYGSHRPVPRNAKEIKHASVLVRRMALERTQKAQDAFGSLLRPKRRVRKPHVKPTTT